MRHKTRRRLSAADKKRRQNPSCLELSNAKTKEISERTALVKENRGSLHHGLPGNAWKGYCVLKKPMPGPETYTGKASPIEEPAEQKPTRSGRSSRSRNS